MRPASCGTRLTAKASPATTRKSGSSSWQRRASQMMCCSRTTTSSSASAPTPSTRDVWWLAGDLLNAMNLLENYVVWRLSDPQFATLQPQIVLHNHAGFDLSAWQADTQFTSLRMDTALYSSLPWWATAWPEKRRPTLIVRQSTPDLLQLVLTGNTWPWKDFLHWRGAYMIEGAAELVDRGRPQARYIRYTDPFASEELQSHLNMLRNTAMEYTIDGDCRDKVREVLANALLSRSLVHKRFSATSWPCCLSIVLVSPSCCSALHAAAQPRLRFIPALEQSTPVLLHQPRMLFEGRKQ